MHHRRFDIREERDGSWTVIDIFTGQPGELFGEPMVDLTIEEADDIVEILNRADDVRRKGLAR